MKKLTTYDIAYIIRRFDLKTRQDFKDFGLTLKYKRSGAFRATYQIVGYNLIVKIPIGDFYYNKEHSLDEWRMYKRLSKLKKYKTFHKYLPEIHCCSPSGVILMEKYSLKGERAKATAQVRNIAYTLFGSSCDVYKQNVGLDKKGQLKILDFGCFSGI
jgi:hypothetical protein